MYSAKVWLNGKDDIKAFSGTQRTSVPLTDGHREILGDLL